MRRKASAYEPAQKIYDLPGERVRKVDAVAWVAKQVYPGDTNTEARKKVRERMRYHNLGGRVELNAPAYFSWTIQQWPQLANIPGIPRATGASDVNISLPALSCSAHVIDTPLDRQELERRHLVCESERWQLQQRVAELEAENAGLREKLQNFLDKEARIREQTSRGGRKGAAARWNE